MEQAVRTQDGAVSDFEYRQDKDEIWTPAVQVVHRDEEYDQADHQLLLKMQEDHFWYRGRHRFLAAALRQCLRRVSRADGQLRAIDLGGGCGGWIRYLKENSVAAFTELALADSSRSALQMAAPVIGSDVGRYQVDLLNLGWQARWDVIFALDVLEHLPHPEAALVQIRRALAPGGFAFISLPALQFFWSYYDELAGHQRRYSRRDLTALAGESGLHLLTARYFMFFLSPLVLLSRLRRPKLARMSPGEIHALFERVHRIPFAPLNRILSIVFAAETPLGLHLPFPWGTSLLGVCRNDR